MTAMTLVLIVDSAASRTRNRADRSAFTSTQKRAYRSTAGRTAPYS